MPPAQVINNFGRTTALRELIEIVRIELPLIQYCRPYLPANLRGTSAMAIQTHALYLSPSYASIAGNKPQRTGIPKQFSNEKPSKDATKKLHSLWLDCHEAIQSTRTTINHRSKTQH